MFSEALANINKNGGGLKGKNVWNESRVPLHKGRCTRSPGILSVSAENGLKALDILQRFELNAKWQVDYYSLSLSECRHAQRRTSVGACLSALWPALLHLFLSASFVVIVVYLPSSFVLLLFIPHRPPSPPQPSLVSAQFDFLRTRNIHQGRWWCIASKSFSPFPLHLDDNIPSRRSMCGWLALTFAASTAKQNKKKTSE